MIASNVNLTKVLLSASDIKILFRTADIFCLFVVIFLFFLLSVLGCYQFYPSHVVHFEQFAKKKDFRWFYFASVISELVLSLSALLDSKILFTNPATESALVFHSCLHRVSKNLADLKVHDPVGRSDLPLHQSGLSGTLHKMADTEEPHRVLRYHQCIRSHRQQHTCPGCTGEEHSKGSVQQWKIEKTSHYQQRYRAEPTTTLFLPIISQPRFEQ